MRREGDGGMEGEGKEGGRVERWIRSEGESRSGRAAALNTGRVEFAGGFCVCGSTLSTNRITHTHANGFGCVEGDVASKDVCFMTTKVGTDEVAEGGDRLSEVGDLCTESLSTEGVWVQTDFTKDEGGTCGSNAIDFLKTTEEGGFGRESDTEEAMGYERGGGVEGGRV